MSEVKGERGGRQLSKQDRGEDRLATYAFRHRRYKTDRVRAQIGRRQQSP